MPKYDDEIKDVVTGDHKTVRRSISALNTSDPLAEAWLSVKETDDANAAAIFMKHITPVRVPGQGEITVPMNSETATGEVLFEFLPADTRSLTKGQKYYFDIQILTEGEIINTPIKGTVTPIGDITKAPES